MCNSGVELVVLSYRSRKAAGVPLEGRRKIAVLLDVTQDFPTTLRAIRASLNVQVIIEQ
jgi:hypothetical protein